MKVIVSAILAMNFFSAFAVAGPGVSSGDEPGFELDFVCSQKPQVQDSAIVTEFGNLNSAHPVVRLYLPTGETSVKMLQGSCKQLAGADELFLNCQVKDGHVTYLIVLASTGGPVLFSTVETKNTHKPKIQLECENAHQ